jgi:hypothetical protein
MPFQNERRKSLHHCRSAEAIQRRPAKSTPAMRLFERAKRSRFPVPEDRRGLLLNAMQRVLLGDPA